MTKRPPELLCPEECRALIRKCSRRAPTGVRNAAMLAVMYRAGLRLGELLALEPRDVDLDGGSVRVRHGKGDKDRVVGIDAGTVALVERWLKVRKAPRKARLFCTLQGGEIAQQYVRAMMGRLARRCDIDKPVHPHALRHAYAAELEREAFTVSQIRDLLGHSSIATTDAYLRRLTGTTAADKAREREWSLA